MPTTFDELADALRERIAIIGDETSRRDAVQHMQRLEKISARLEQLERQLPSDADPRLRHFLQRRSYTKALDLLNESIAPRSTAR